MKCNKCGFVMGHVKTYFKQPAKGILSDSSVFKCLWSCCKNVANTSAIYTKPKALGGPG